MEFEDLVDVLDIEGRSVVSSWPMVPEAADFEDDGFVVAHFHFLSTSVRTRLLISEMALRWF